MKKIIYIFTYSALVLLATIGCAPNSDIHSQEASAFCDVYNPDNWQDFKQNFSYSDFQTELTKRISQVVVSPEFKNIFKELSETPYSPDLNVYTFYKVRISKLIGKEWDCPNAEKFYSGKWRRVKNNTKLSNTTKEDLTLHKINEVVLKVTNSGDLYLNSKKLKNSELNTLKEALNLKSLSEPPSVLILKGPNVDQKLLVSLLDSLSKLGITKLRMGEIETASH